MATALRTSFACTRLHLHRVGTCRTSTTAFIAGEPNIAAIGQGGRLQVYLPNSNVVFRITTAWTDACGLTFSALPSEALNEGMHISELKAVKILDFLDVADSGLKIIVDEARQHISIATASVAEDAERAYLVEAVVPEIFSVDLTASRGNADVVKKLKGDCIVRLGEGDINAGVVRGERTELRTGRGRVFAQELEGNVSITGTEVDVNLMNGAKVQIDAVGDNSSVRIGGIYSPTAEVSSVGKIAISSCHGSIDASTTGNGGDVSLASVNGAAQVCTGYGNVNVHMEALERGTCSSIRSEAGDVFVSMSQEVSAVVDLAGKLGDLPPMLQGNVQTRRAVGKIINGSKSQAPNAGGGKIDLTGAREQSLSNFIRKDAGSADLPQLKVSTSEGSIGLDIVSWIDNITRRFNEDRGPDTQRRSDWAQRD